MVPLSGTTRQTQALCMISKAFCASKCNNTNMKSLYIMITIIRFSHIFFFKWLKNIKKKWSPRFSVSQILNQYLNVICIMKGCGSTTYNTNMPPIHSLPWFQSLARLTMLANQLRLPPRINLPLSIFQGYLLVIFFLESVSVRISNCHFDHLYHQTTCVLITVGFLKFNITTNIFTSWKP